MIVLNLRCSKRHHFEGWFGSNDDFSRQSVSHLLICPICGDHDITRLPSSPRIRRQSNVSAAQPEQPAGQGVAADDGASKTMLELVRRVLDESEDVGDRFPDEARRIHYRETRARSIRGVATREETTELLDEGIVVLPLPIPPSRDMH
jgi:hypothetical protein